MTNVKNLLLAIVLLAAASYGGFKGYVHYQVSSELDKMISMARPFADISYDGITSTLDGSVTIEGIRVQPQGTPEALAIDVVSVKGDGALFLLKAVSGIKQGEPPERLTIRLLGFTMPLTGDLAFSYSGMFKGVGEQGKGSVRPLKDCALGSWAYPEELRILGLQQLVMDADMSYEFRKVDGYLHVTMESSIRDIETTTLNIEVSGMPQPGAMMMGALPRVEDFTIGYALDPTFAARSLERCADVRGLPMPVFVDSLFEGENPPVAQVLGIVPGPGITAALKKYLVKPEHLTISVRPPADLDISTLMLYKPQDIALLLNTNLVVNGEKVDDLRFEVATAVLEEMDESGFLSKLPGMEEAAAKAAKKKESEEKPKPKIQMRYLSTPVRELSQHVGRDVRIYTRTSDVIREGELTSIKGDEITVLQRVHRGKLSVHVPMADIKRAEVLQIVESGEGL